jgi:MoxR-like ATPase
MDTTTTTSGGQCWRDLEDTIGSGLARVCLYGPPGTGKTYSALTYGLDGRESYKIACVDDMTTAQIEGMWKPSRDGWSFHEGAAVKAWRTGGRLVIDEIDKASGDVLGALLAFCDSEASARWDHPDTNEIVRPAAGFSVIVTTNSHPTALAEALRDRFPVAIEVTEPHPVALAALPEWMREPARLLANANDEARVSLRAFQALAVMIESVGLERAAALVMPQHAGTITAAARIASIGGDQ